VSAPDGRTPPPGRDGGAGAGGPGRWDVAALRAGAGVCAVFAVPLQVIAQLLGRDSGLADLLTLASFGGFVLGGGVAAWSQRSGLALSHSLVTVLGTFIALQVLFVLARAVSGGDLRLLNALFNVPLVLVAGLLGGALGTFLRRNGSRPSTQWEDGRP
jgi:hypothetical protein